jgi:hypothetical protein
VTVEDRLRATTEAVTAAMRPVRPLDLPPSRSAARATAKQSRARSPRHWSGWLVPVAAAVAVIAVAATLVAVRTVSGPAPHGESQSGPATSGGVADPDQVPAYYAMIGKPTTVAPADVTIAETATGKALFTIKPPKNTSFANVTAAADDRTFVVSVAPFGTRGPVQATLSWDLLRISPGATSYTLRRLSIPAMPPNTLLGGLALSPDGTELAVMFHSNTAAALIEGTATLSVYSVASGQALHTWQSVSKQSLEAIGANSDPSGTVTWLANGHGLAFVWDAAQNTGQDLLKVTPEVWRLDLAKPPATGLLAGSTPVAMIPTGVFVASKPGVAGGGWVNGICSRLYATADGNGAVCGTQSLLAGSTPVVKIPTGVFVASKPGVAGGGWVNGICSRLYATADGNGAVCGTQSLLAVPNGTTNCRATLPPLTFRAYSGDGSYRVLYTVPSAKAPKGKCVDGIAGVLWASPSGSTLVGVVSTALVSGSLNFGPFTSVVGVLAHGRWTPLPIHVQLSQVAGLAF